MSLICIREYTIIKTAERNQMVTFFPNNPITHISNGIIENVTTENNANLVTISYTERINNREVPRTAGLVVGRNTTAAGDRSLSSIIRFNVPESHNLIMPRGIVPRGICF